MQKRQVGGGVLGLRLPFLVREARPPGACPLASARFLGVSPHGGSSSVQCPAEKLWSHLTPARGWLLNSLTPVAAVTFFLCEVT